MRGLNEGLFSGNVKFLINSISLNSTRSGSAQSALRFPVNQLERIEVIRGSGSALHGPYAYTGVINLVTRKTGSQVFLRKGRYDTHTGGGVFSWSSPENDLDLSVNLAGWETDGANVRTGPDFLSGIGLSAISLAPGRTSEYADHYSAGAFLAYKDFRLLVNF